MQIQLMDYIRIINVIIIEIDLYFQNDGNFIHTYACWYLSSYQYAYKHKRIAKEKIECKSQRSYKDYF